MLKKIVKELSTINDIKLIILYGSFARGDYGPKSDLDLFILTTRQETMNSIQDKIIDIEEKIGKSIQPTVRTYYTCPLTHVFLLLYRRYDQDPFLQASLCRLSLLPWVLW